MSYRWKLFFFCMALVLLLGGIFYFAAISIMEKQMMSQSRESLLHQARLVRMLVEREGGMQSSPQLLARLIGAQIGERVTLIAPDGRVLGESGVLDEQLALVENHLSRSEVQEALSSPEGYGYAVRVSNTVGTSLLYAALRCSNSKTIGVVRIALPLTHLDQTRHSLQRFLGVVCLVLLVLALILSALLASLATKPLREIGECAARIGRGEIGVRATQKEQGEIGYLALRMNEMAERVESQMRRLSTEKQRLDTILKGMGEGVMVTSTAGVISLVNPAFKKMFGITGEVVGKSLVEISRHPDLLAAFSELGKADVNELVRDIVIQSNNSTLLTHWVHLEVDGVRQGIVAVFHDISDLKKMENMRRDFVANVSHELRTPVTIIKGYAETLLEGALESDPAHAKRFVEIISSHSERLTSLINDILTLSSLETKEALIELNPLDVSGTVSKACMLLQERAAQKNISIINEVVGGALPRVIADQGRLEQVMVNLLENAIKYTPDGGTVRLSTEDSGEFVRVIVADTGIGIPLKDQPRIFERFYRVDEARTREQGGTGLGLAIVKHIVQLHGGSVSVTSGQGKGSIFSFSLMKA